MEGRKTGHMLLLKRLKEGEGQGRENSLREESPHLGKMLTFKENADLMQSCYNALGFKNMWNDHKGKT